MSNDAKGGDIKLQNWALSAGESKIMSGAGPVNGGQSGRILFMVGPEKGKEPIEMMRFEPNGDIFIRNEKVDNNYVVYEQVKQWLGLVITTRQEGAAILSNRKEQD